MWVLYIFPFVPLFVAIILAIIGLRDIDKEEQEDEDAVHYAERIINNKFVTSCGLEISLDSRKVANFIPKVTCRKCLEKIT